MTAHASHEASLEVGLADGCPRCEEHAQRPLDSLDAAHLNDLWLRMVRWEYLDAEDARPRSEAEALAMSSLREHARFLRRVGWTVAELGGVVF